MSGRIRTIKPELLEDEKTAALAHDEWRTFVSTLLVVDDYGNCRANPDFLQGQVLWGSPPSRDFREILARLSELGLVTPYTVRGQSYLHVTNWSRHQKVDRPGKPRVPGPNEADSGPLATPSRDPRETLATDPDLRPRTTDRDGDEETPPPPPETSAGRGKAPDPFAAYGATQWPPDFQPSVENIANAKSAELDIAEEVAGLRANAKRHARVSCDWHAELDGWMVKSVKFRRQAESGNGPGQRRGRVPQDNAGLTGLEGVERI